MSNLEYFVSIFTQLRMQQKMLALSILFALGFVGFGFGAFSTLETLRINGAHYQRIVQGKDLVADILPPPVYLVEAYLVSFQAANETNPALAEANLQRLEVLKSEYQTRHDFWKNQLEAGELRKKLLDEAHAPAVTFLKLVSEDLSKAVKARDLSAARSLVNGPLKVAYNEHRQAIDETVKLATVRNTADEKRAADLIITRYMWLMAFGLVAMVSLSGLALLVGKDLARSIRIMVVFMRELQMGHIVAARNILKHL